MIGTLRPRHVTGRQTSDGSDGVQTPLVMTPKIRETSHIMESMVLHPQSQQTAILLMEEIRLTTWDV